MGARSARAAVSRRLALPAVWVCGDADGNMVALQVTGLTPDRDG
jgi:hypothetical protein